MQDFRKLIVWQKAHELALETYRITAEFPKDEIFGLRHSLRKTAVDIPGYVAEGAGKERDEDFAASVGYSLSLAMRLEYYALMAFDLGFLSEDVYSKYTESLIEVKKMLGGFRRSLQNG